MTITYTDADGARQEVVLEPVDGWRTDPVLSEMHLGLTLLQENDRLRSNIEVLKSVIVELRRDVTGRDVRVYE